MSALCTFNLDGEVVVIRWNWQLGTQGQTCLVWMVLLLSGLGGLLPQPTMAQTPSQMSAPPIFWADGITRANQLDDYAETGFNTVVIRLFWQPTPDGSIVASDLQPQRAFAEQAAKRQLNIIYSLPPSPFGEENKYAYSGEAGPYRVMWANWAQRAIAQLKDTPNLIGWMLPDDPRSLRFVNNQNFSRWIGANYGTLEVLNRQWNTRFQTREQVTLGATRQIIEQWRGPVLPYAPMSDGQARAYIQQAQRRSAKDNFAFHPASLALAQFQWDSYRDLLNFWATMVRNADPLRKIYSGQLPDYAQLLSLPPTIDVSVPSMSPAIMEPDLATHNPQAVNIARRGGRFQAIPVLSTRLPQAAPASLARLTPSWMDAAFSQGAGGLAFDSWANISSTPALRHAISSSLQRLQDEQHAMLWGQSPTATVAIVLTPLADGVTLRVNRPPAAQDQSNSNQQDTDAPPIARGVYGFGEDMIGGEPNRLIYALRWGTMFGNVDFLSPDELGGTYSVSLSGSLKRYSTVLLPQALYVSPAMAQELANYVAAGGVIVSDLGFGAAQNAGRVVGLPPELTALLGVVPTSLQAVSFNLKSGQGHPLLPTWAAQIAMKAKTLTAGSGPDAAAFAGPTTFGELLPGTVPLALAFDLTQKIPGQNGRAPLIRVNRSWLTLRPFGQGASIHAPFHLWSFWQPGMLGFDTFHGDLFARQHAISIAAAPSLTPSPAGIPNGTAAFCQVVNFPNAIALLNHNAGPNTPYRGGILRERIPAVSSASLPQSSAITPSPGIVPDLSSAAPTPAVKAHSQFLPETPSTGNDKSSEEAPIVMTPEEIEALFGKKAMPKPKSLPKPSPTPTPAPSGEAPITLTPQELEELLGKPVIPPSAIPEDATPNPAAPFVPQRVPSNPPQPAVVQTSGAEYFLWRNALCIFPIGAAPNTTLGRSAPLPEAVQEFAAGSIVRPTLYHPLTLYTFVPGMEMKILQPVSVRVQHAQGGAFAANIAEYTPKKISLRIWPNTDAAFIRANEWRLRPGREGTVRISIFDGQNPGDYRVAPNSRHLLTISEFSSDDDVSVLSRINHTLVADRMGRLFIEYTGQSIGIEIKPI